jgi:hypothetical protein
MGNFPVKIAIWGTGWHWMVPHVQGQTSMDVVYLMPWSKHGVSRTPYDYRGFA